MCTYRDGFVRLLTGRGVKKPMWILIGTIGAVAFALLATITGQALMASILALIMSGVMMFRGALGGNFGSPASAMANGRITAYEILRPADFAEPAPLVHDHNHHHAALTAVVPIVREDVAYEPHDQNPMDFERRETFGTRKMLSTGRHFPHLI